jgi:hypothetical protein
MLLLGAARWVDWGRGLPGVGFVFVWNRVLFTVVGGYPR